MSIRYAMPQITKFSLGSKTVCPAGAELFIFSSPLLRAVAVCVIKKKKKKRQVYSEVAEQVGESCLVCCCCFFFYCFDDGTKQKDRLESCPSFSAYTFHVTEYIVFSGFVNRSAPDFPSNRMMKILLTRR